jgi:integrase/recombinase XerD
MAKKMEFPELGRFVEHMLGEKESFNTIKTYTLALRDLLKWARKAPGDITPDDLEKYRIHLAVEKKYAKATIYLHIKAVQAFFKFLKLDAAKDIKPPKRPGSLPKYLTEDEAHRLLEAASGNARDYAILVVLGYSGLRVSELCHLDIEDLDLTNTTVRVRSGKGDKDRVVIVEDKTVEAIRRYLQVRVPPKKHSQRVFISEEKTPISPRTVERIVRKYALDAGINKKVTPHVLRHTLATTLLRRGADIRFIQKILGHSSISTTQVYTHVDEDMLRKAYEKSKPDY